MLELVLISFIIFVGYLYFRIKRIHKEIKETWKIKKRWIIEILLKANIEQDIKLQNDMRRFKRRNIIKYEIRKPPHK